MYRICIKEPFMNCNKIYPIQQKRVKSLIDHISEKDFVKKIIIFGSSVSDLCHIDSDVDIYCELTEDKKVITKYFDFEFDLLTNYMTDERIMNEINEDGVLVYEN